MAKKHINGNDSARHLNIGIWANLISTLLLAGSYYSESPALKIAACLGAILLWVLLACAIKFLIRPRWKKVRNIGYYFILTCPIFWAFHEHRLRLLVEKELRRLKEILGSWPTANVLEKIINPVTRKEGLKEILTRMKNMNDRDLALVIGRIRYYAKEILDPEVDSENYNLFRELIEKLSLNEPQEYMQSYDNLLGLLSDTFDMQTGRSFSRQIQKDMIQPLKNAICRIDKAHLNAVRGVVEKIMLDSEDDHDLARAIMEMLLILDPKKQKPALQIVFDECKKRAFHFPEHFGYDFLQTLNKLEHKVFYLDLWSLRDIIIEPTPLGRRGLIDSNRNKYSELCTKAFAVPEDPQHSGIRRGRVFRRLKYQDGQVIIDCTLPNGETCHCEGVSSSLRGIYSKKCVRQAGERLPIKIVPISERNQQYDFTASVAKLHTDESGNRVQGRGILFEGAEESVAKGLYDYISQH